MQPPTSLVSTRPGPTPTPTDRTTPLGEIINKYLRKEMELDDRAAHLLFSANRWELRCVPLSCRTLPLYPPRNVLTP